MISFSQKILSYGVTVERWFNTSIGEISSTVRYINLQLQPRDEGVNQMQISFSENWSGSIHNLSFPSMPIQDYDDIYKILQTEKPVYVRVLVGDKKELLHFAISTEEKEPTGEGPRDETP